MPEKSRMNVGDRTWRGSLPIVAMMTGILAIISVGYAVFPRHPDLLAFDPVAMAHSETMMWRHYYDRRYLSLFADLYENARTAAAPILRQSIYRRPVQPENAGDDLRAFAFLDLTHRAFTQRFQRMMIQSARIIFLHTGSESLNTGTVNKSRYTYELINNA
jgi:hypothetical protein